MWPNNYKFECRKSIFSFKIFILPHVLTTHALCRRGAAASLAPPSYATAIGTNYSKHLILQTPQSLI